MKTLSRLLPVSGTVYVLTSVIVCSSAFGVEQTLRNDSFSGAGSVQCVSGLSFAEGEIAAARFTPDPGSYPFQVMSVQILACPNGTQSDLVLLIWADDGESNEPGDLLYDGVFTLFGSNVALNELDVSFEGITVDSGGIRVGIQYWFGPATTGLAGDLDGYVMGQPNFIYAEDPPLQFQWIPADTLGVIGDWIMRVVIDAPEAPPIFADGFDSGDTDLWSAVVP